MSLGYAQKLSYREDVGTVGMSEIIDAPEILQEKIEELAMLIQKSKHLVAFTGAGISTSCGIPDFRGPKGVWTLQRAGKGVPDASLPFDRAMPSFTHMALVELEKAGILKFVISQNVDGLHLRSGIPREKLAELHGNSFREVCPSCGIEYIRDFEIETIGMKETSRRCSNEACGAKLKDTVLDWEDALPPKEMNPAQKHCKMADIVLCLGTSLQITPACNLPLKCLANGGRIIIINLQPTPKDKKAKLVIHGQVDKVIAGAMQFLNLRIPPYVRIDLIQFTLSHILKRRIKYVQWTLRITSVHGNRAPLPFLKSVEVSFPERSDLKTAVLDKQPFFLKRETLKTRPFKMVLDLYFGDGCGCLCTRIEWNVNFQNVIAGSPYSLIPSFHGSALSASPIWEIFHKIISFDKVWDDPFHDGTSYQESEVTRDAFSHDKLAVLQKLRDAAITDSCCGQYAAVERKLITSSKSKSSESDVTVYAIVTNISRHNSNLLPDPIPGGMNKTSSRSTPNQRGTGGATTRAVWNPLVDQLFANVMVNYMMHTRKSAGEWLDSAGWDMVASEFNRRNSSTYNVNQLKKHFGTLKRLYKSVKELLAVSGFQWDESSKLVVAKVAVWDNYLKSHPSAAQFRTTAFPAYELMSILCGDSSDFKSFDKLGGSSPMARDAASASSSQDVLGKPQLSPDEVSCSLASKENGNFVFQFEGDTRNPLPRRKRSLTPVHLHHCKRECVKQIRSDISDSLCEMETKPKFMRDQRRPEAQSPADYSISNCVKELMKIAPVNPMSRVIASRHFENSNLREMFMVWGKEERIAWLDMISKEH